jgi:hypothetical protein
MQSSATPRGSTENIKVGLNQTGRRLLAQSKNHRLKVKLVITQGHKTVASRTIVFKAKPPVKHKKKR